MSTPFGDETLTLSLSNLPAHSTLTLRTDMQVASDQQHAGADFAINVVGQQVYHWAADGSGGGESFDQSFTVSSTGDTATITFVGSGFGQTSQQCIDRGYDDPFNEWSFNEMWVSVEPPPTVSVLAYDESAAEGPSPVSDVAVARFTRSGGDITQPLDVTYTVTDQTTSPSDYESLSGQVTIPANSTFADVVVTPIDDTLGEGIESLAISAVASANYTVLGTAAVIEIADDDAQFRPDPQDLFVQQNPSPSQSTMKVSAGETVTLHGSAVDEDQKSTDGGVSWQNVQGEGPYEIQMTIAGKAKFSNGDRQLVLDGLDSGNVKVTTDPGWTANDPAITVTMKLVDKGERDRKDNNKTVSWTLQRRQTAPTTMTVAGGQQAKVNQWVDVTNGPLSIEYVMGPDLNSDNTPDYVGQSVQESFSEASGAYGFTLDDLTDAWKQAHGNPQTLDAAAALIFTSGRNATFVIDAVDHITDANEGAAIDSSAFKPGALSGKTIGCKMVQTFTVTDPNDPSKLSLNQSYDLFTELRVDNQGNFTKWVKKSA
jgi:hypothetical protein